MIPVRGALFTLGAALAAFLLWWGYSKYQDVQDAKDAAWKAKVHVAELARDSALIVAARTDTLYKQGETVYVRGRNILLNPGPGKPPATPEVKACFALSDSLLSLCAKRHDADTAALHATERELKLYQDKPSGIRRVQAYGESQYDLVHKAPVFRIGATAHVIGPISISAAGDLSIPPAGQSRTVFRGLVGLRVDF